MPKLTINPLPKLNVGDKVRLIKTLHSGLDLVSDKVVTVIEVDRLGNFSVSGKRKELTHNRFTPDGIPLFKTTGEIQPLSFDSSIAFPYFIPPNTKSIKSVIRSKGNPMSTYLIVKDVIEELKNSNSKSESERLGIKLADTMWNNMPCVLADLKDINASLRSVVESSNIPNQKVVLAKVWARLVQLDSR